MTTACSWYQFRVQNGQLALRDSHGKFAVKKKMRTSESAQCSAARSS
jgi:hypothetical protein